MRWMRRICYTIFSVTLGGCTPIGGIPNDAPLPAIAPSQALATIAATSTTIDARIAALCQQPGTRIARPAPTRVQCCRLLPPEGAARAILTYDGSLTALPETVLEFDTSALPQLRLTAYVDIPRKDGSTLRLAYPGLRTQRQLMGIIRRLGATAAPE